MYSIEFYYYFLGFQSEDQIYQRSRSIRLFLKNEKDIQTNKFLNTKHTDPDVLFHLIQTATRILNQVKTCKFQDEAGNYRVKSVKRVLESCILDISINLICKDKILRQPYAKEFKFAQLLVNLVNISNDIFLAYNLKLPDQWNQDLF